MDSPNAPATDEFWAFNPQQPPPVGASSEDTSLDELLALYQTSTEAPGGAPFAPMGEPDRYPAFGGDAFAFCQHFIETEHVAFTPGIDFGRYQASHHVRFAYTQSVERLQQAVERIARGLKTWRP